MLSNIISNPPQSISYDDLAGIVWEDDAMVEGGKITAYGQGSIEGIEGVGEGLFVILTHAILTGETRLAVTYDRHVSEGNSDGERPDVVYMQVAIDELFDAV